MNRMDEFYSYKSELSSSIPDLSAANAISRAKKHRKHSLLWKAPMLSLLSTAALFILLVNLFPAVALGMSKLPYLEDLVAAVAFNPSLKIAVDNDYVQIVGDRQSKDEVTASVEYMIIDAGHISIFFKIDAPVEAGQWRYDFFDDHGYRLPAAISYDTMYETGKLEEINLDYLDGSDIPAELQFKLNITVAPNYQETQTAIYDPATGEYTAPQSDTGREYEFLFHLYPDEAFRKNIVSLPIHQWVDLEGQRIYLDYLNIYPTQARLFLEVDPDNTALLKGLDITFVDEKGNRFDPKAGGITGTYDTDALNMNSLFYESSYFFEADHLTMLIEGMSLMDKDGLYGLVQYDTKSITNMPEGVSVRTMKMVNTTLLLTLDSVSEENPWKMSCLDPQYYDLEGKEYSFNSYSSSINEKECTISTEYKIDNFKDHYYKLRWNYAPLHSLEKPVEINVK